MKEQMRSTPPLRYISIHDAASMVGYTPDYVNRLVRKQQVNTKQCNDGTILVDRDSIKCFQLNVNAQKVIRKESAYYNRTVKQYFKEASEQKIAQPIPTLPSMHGTLIRSATLTVAVMVIVFLGGVIASSEERHVIITMRSSLVGSVQHGWNQLMDSDVRNASGYSTDVDR